MSEAEDQIKTIEAQLEVLKTKNPEANRVAYNRFVAGLKEGINYAISHNLCDSQQLLGYARTFNDNVPENPIDYLGYPKTEQHKTVEAVVRRLSEESGARAIDSLEFGGMIRYVMDNFPDIVPEGEKLPDFMVFGVSDDDKFVTRGYDNFDDAMNISRRYPYMFVMRRNSENSKMFDVVYGRTREHEYDVVGMAFEEILQPEEGETVIISDDIPKDAIDLTAETPEKPAEE